MSVENPKGGMTKSQKHIERVRMLMEQHGWKLNVPSSILAPEDKAKLSGGLKCFRMVYDRDKDGVKLKTMHRCGNPAAKGSFFCKKKHGGGNQNNLIHGKNSMTSSAYRGAFKTELGDLFDTFLNDPAISDLRPEIAAIRTAYRTYMNELSASSKRVKNPLAALKVIKNITKDKLLTPEERFAHIKEFCSRQATLTDGEALERIVAIGESISKIVERMNKIQNKEEFMLTIDGLKIIFRCVIDVLKEHVTPETLKLVKDNLITISARTQGDLSKYGELKQLEVPSPLK